MAKKKDIKPKSFKYKEYEKYLGKKITNNLNSIRGYDKKRSRRPTTPDVLDVLLVSFIFESEEADLNLDLFVMEMDTTVSPYQIETALIDTSGLRGFGVRLTMDTNMLVTMLSTLSDYLALYPEAQVLKDMEVSTGKAMLTRLPNNE